MPILVHFKAKNNDNSYFYKNSGLSFQWVPYYVKLVNETITSQAYQDNIKSDIKLLYESCVNILKSYCKVRYLVECLGYSAFILE